MPQSKLLNKDTKKNNDKIILTKTIEEQLTKQDLENMLFNIKRQKQQLVQQSKQIKQKFDLLTQQEEEVKELLNMFSEENIIILE